MKDILSSQRCRQSAQPRRKTYGSGDTDHLCNCFGKHKFHDLKQI